MEQNAFNLYGIAAMREILSFFEGHALSSHMAPAVPALFLFSWLSLPQNVQWPSGTGPISAGPIQRPPTSPPLTMALPFLWDTQLVTTPGGCQQLGAVAHIQLDTSGYCARVGPCGLFGGKGTSMPVYIVHGKTTGCTAFCAIQRCLFSLRMITMLWPRTTSFVWSRGWHSPPHVVAGPLTMSLH
jgi:hypothetical protein